MAANRSRKGRGARRRTDRMARVEHDLSDVRAFAASIAMNQYVSG
ncbi:MAG: hypothetical protein QNM02_15185 [Acidimicrobiia bacterium]|nr:hypothetical protein [Acidimicrobiia bacterium]